MIKDITKNMNVIESMIYFWTAVGDREKVGERFLSELSEYQEMKLLYDETFDAESVRKSLSAITNREMLNGGSQKERQFWNNNMWMLEDIALMQEMVNPLKQLNLDSLANEINSIKDIAHELIEVIFIPANKEEFFVIDNKLVINFFKLQADIITGAETKIAGMSIKEYVKQRIIENF